MREGSQLHLERNCMSKDKRLFTLLLVTYSFPSYKIMALEESESDKQEGCRTDDAVFYWDINFPQCYKTS
jgi:hypothetical protein